MHYNHTLIRNLYFTLLIKQLFSYAPSERTGHFLCSNLEHLPHPPAKIEHKIYKSIAYIIYLD